MRRFNKLARWAAFPTLAGIAVASIVAIGTRPSTETEASSHREAPAISADPQADATDTYVFIPPGKEDKVVLVGNWIPLQEPAGGPNFFNFGDDVAYEFAIDNDGDAKPDIAYSLEFYTRVEDPSTFLYATGPITSLGDATFNIKQFYDVYRWERGHGRYDLVASGLQTPPNNIGPTSTPNYEALAKQAVFDLPGGGKVFAGQRDDPFFVDLGAVFDLATIRSLPGNAGGGIDGVGGFNTNSIVLELPIASVTKCKCDAPAPTQSSGTGPAPNSNASNLIVGVWTDTYRQKTNVFHRDGSQEDRGPDIKVSRLGNPLVNEVVIPLSHKDRFNASFPRDDAQFLPFVLNSDLAEKLNIVYNGVVTPIPETGRNDLVTVFLTGIPGLNQPPNVVPSEQLRINLGIKPSSCGAFNRLGVIAGDNCGFPNGRRLADDSTDVELRAVACGYGFNFPPCVDSAPNNLLGDGVDGNDVPFLTEFPYLGTPHDGFDHEHHTGNVVTSVSAGVGAATAAFGMLLAGTTVVNRVRRRRADDEADV